MPRKKTGYKIVTKKAGTVTRALGISEPREDKIDNLVKVVLRENVKTVALSKLTEHAETLEEVVYSAYLYGALNTKKRCHEENKVAEVMREIFRPEQPKMSWFDRLFAVAVVLWTTLLALQIVEVFFS